VTIPAQTWTIESTDQASNRFGFNGGRRELHRVKTAAITFDVKPKPDNYPLDATWLPANNINIAETWSQSPEQFKVGEPITRTVTLAAEGLSAEQLPPIFSEQEVDGFKFYPDKPNIENQTTGAGSESSSCNSVRPSGASMSSLQRF
jgi:hypothetical protein